MHLIDTTANAAGPFAPPAGWEGDQYGYRALMRDRYRVDMAARQQMGVVSMRLRLVTFDGPWATEAREIAAAISERLDRQQRRAA